MVVVIAGGSGFLGQALLSYFHESSFMSSTSTSLIYTYASFEEVTTHENYNFATAVRVDWCTSDGITALTEAIGDQRLHAVIYLAAISSPAFCEANPDIAYALNVPLRLLDWLRTLHSDIVRNTVLVLLSSDHVYSGNKHGGMYQVETIDNEQPVNVYGRTKLLAEETCLRIWPRTCCLRSSVMYGRPPPVSVGRTLLLEWLDSIVSSGNGKLFVDEYRCPIAVEDVCRVIEMVALTYPERFIKRVWNMGGPERLSRASMGDIIAQVRGYNVNSFERISVASVKRTCPSPIDVSMDTTMLEDALGWCMTPFIDGVRYAFRDIE